MINLLPTDTKRELRAARTNALLIRYTVILIIAGIFANVVLAGSYFLLTQTKESQEMLIEANDTKAQAFSDTQNEISALSATLSGARGVLDQQLAYSKALRNIGSSMPAGTIIEKLDLSATSFNGTTPLTLDVYATTNDATVALRDQLSAAGYFSNINLDSVSESGGIDGYPISASLTMTLNGTIAQ
jgi:hypothetical protein